MQAKAVVHETSESPLEVAPAGLGVGSLDQLVPFQISARVSEVPALLYWDPTAVQAVADVHETEENPALWAEAGDV